MIEQFFKFLEPINLLFFTEELCTHVKITSNIQFRDVLASTSWLAASRSARGESLGLSQVLSENAHSSTQVHELLDSQEYIQTFQSPCGHLIFFSSFSG